MRTYSANAIVLRRIDLGEKDRIVTFYTREAGKLSAVAKGARRPGSRLSGPSEPFTCSRLSLARGRDLDIVSQAETRESFPNIRSDIRAIAHAVYVLELVSSFVDERQPNPDLYDTLLSTLYIMESGADPEIAVRYFELQVLSILGFEPAVESCSRCGRTVASTEEASETAFSASCGGLVCRECGAPPGDTIFVPANVTGWLKAIRQAEPHRLKDVRVPAGVRRCLAAILRRHIRYRLERELRSTEFIKAVESMEARTV